MATTYLSFSTTTRAHRSDAVNHAGKAGTSNIAKLTESEWETVRNLIEDATALVNPASIDTTLNYSLSLTSGSLVRVQLTV